MGNSFVNGRNNVEIWWKQNKELLRKNIVETMRNDRVNNVEILQIMVYLLDNMKIEGGIKCVGKVGHIPMKKN